MVVAALAEDGEELGELLFIVTSIPVGNQHEIGLARPYGFIPFLFYSLARIVLQSPIFAGWQGTHKEAIAIIAW